MNEITSAGSTRKRLAEFYERAHRVAAQNRVARDVKYNCVK